MRNFHKRHLLLEVFSVTVVVLFLLSCHRHYDPLIGRWTVEKVKVDFNEQIATPEMVQMWGETEKGNIIEITYDSVLFFIAEGDTMQGNCSLRGRNLYFDGALFGKIEDDVLMTETSTPIGKVKVSYRKQKK